MTVGVQRRKQTEVIGHVGADAGTMTTVWRKSTCFSVRREGVPSFCVFTQRILPDTLKVVLLYERSSESFL